MWDLSIIVLGMNRQTDRQTALCFEGITFYRMIINVCREDAGMNRKLEI